jgi:hypothetical protein
MRVVRLTSLAAAQLLVSSLLITTISTQTNATDQANLSPAASAAFSDVGRCLASGKSKELSVFYLIDNSGSLKWTDPENLRRDILSGSLAELSSFIDQRIAVELAVSFFSTGVTPLLGWTRLDSPDDAKNMASRVAQRISNEAAGGKTDWEKGLRSAYSELESRGDRCKMLIWFTDGGINPEIESEEALFQSLSALCRPGISIAGFRQSNEYGLMSKFRRTQIPVFGVLYSNLDAAYEYYVGFDPTLADDEIARERWRMSFMRALVEGRGQVAAETVGDQKLPSGELQCARVNSQGIATPEEVNGAFLNASDPVALAYQFLKLGTQISGGAGSPIIDGNFVVPPGTAKFVVAIYGENWTLEGPSESGISASESSMKQPVSSRLSAGASAVTVEVLGNSSAYGSWTIETGGKAAELFLYPGLTISLDRDRSSKILSDYANTITGEVIRTKEFEGSPIDLQEYDQSKISVSYLSGDGWMTLGGLEVNLNPNGQFAISNLIPPSGVETLEVQLALDLGPSFNPVESRFTLEVQDKLSLARAQTDNLRLSNLVGPTGNAEGILILQGPNTAEISEFCFAELVRLDDSQTGIEKVDRYSSFEWSFTDQTSGQQGNCFKVGRDQEVSILVRAINPIQAASEVVSVWNITAVTEGIGAQFEAPLKISFTSEVETNVLVTWLVLALLSALGLLLPLGSMWLLNFFTTRFLDIENTTRAAFPVRIEASSPRPLFRDARPGNEGPIVVGPRDFIGVLETKSPRNFDTGFGEAQARIPLFPLNATWYEWQAPQGSRIISLNPNSTKSTRDMKRFLAAEVGPNMAENWALVVSDAELRKQDKSALVGNLVVFARAGNLSNYEEKLKNISNVNGLDSSLKLAAEAAVSAGARAVTSSNDVPPTPPVVPQSSGISAPPIPGFGGTNPASPGSPGSIPSGPPIPGFDSKPPQSNGPTPPPWLPGQDRK